MMGLALIRPVAFYLTIDIDALVEKTLEHGGLVSYKHNARGAQNPYEININYFDALSNPRTNEPLKFRQIVFMTAQAIMLSLIGVPGIYFHSLFGFARAGERAVGT